MKSLRRKWRTDMRLSAVTLWSSFLGAIMTMVLLLAMAPQLEGGRMEWPALGGWFFMSWIASIIPVGCALALSAPPRSERAT